MTSAASNTLRTTTVHARALHVVQVGFDRSLLDTDGKTDSRKRQFRYGEILSAERPGSRITIVVLAAGSRGGRETLGCVELVPFTETRAGLRKPLAWWRLYRLLTALHAECPIDVITTQNVHDEAWVALLFGRFNRCPVVGQIHSDIFNPEARRSLEQGLVGKLRYRLLLRLLPRFDAFRVVGRRIAAALKEHGIRARIDVIPVAMPIMVREADQPAPARNQSGPPTVLYVGRLVPVKNVGAWLEVAQAVLNQRPDCRFRIVGDGPSRAELEGRAREMGMTDRVQFSGWIAYEDLPQCYAEASVFLLTSHYEGFGRVVAEALCFEVPVVGPRIAGVEDIVREGESGYLHPVGDVPAMAESVCRLLSDRELASRFGRQGTEFVHTHYDPAFLAKQWMLMLSECGDRV